MKIARQLCFLLLFALLVPVICLAAPADGSDWHEVFTSAEQDTLETLYREDPSGFITALAGEERSLISQVAQKLVAAQENVNQFFLDLRKTAAGQSWTEQERDVIQTIFSADGQKLLAWIGWDGFLPTEQTGYAELFLGYAFTDGAYAQAYAIQLEKLFHRDTKGFVQELAKLSETTCEQIELAVVTNWQTDTYGDAATVLTELQQQEQWDAAEAQIISNLIGNTDYAPPKTADVGAGEHLFALLAVGLLALAASAVLMWKAPKRK